MDRPGAAPHDSNFIDQLTKGEEKMIVADSAYHSREREAALRARGVVRAIAHKRQRGRKTLPPMLERINRAIARARVVVEHPFAWMKSIGYRRVHYRGRRRFEVDFAQYLIAYNIKKSLSRMRARSRAGERAERRADGPPRRARCEGC